MKKNFLKNLFSILLFLGFLIPSVVPVFAQSKGLLAPTCNGPDCTFNNVVDMAKEIASSTVKLGLIVAPLLFAWAGGLFLQSGFDGDTGKRKKAKNIFKNVVIGIIIMMAAWVIVNLFLSALVCGDLSNGNWFNANIGGCSAS